MYRHFAFVAPTAVPSAPRSLVPSSRVPTTASASAVRDAPRLSRRSQSSLHLDWMRTDVPASFTPPASASRGAAAGPSAAERWAEEMLTPPAPIPDAAADATSVPAGPSAAERWVEEVAARHASAAASMKSKEKPKAAMASLTQAQKSYFARMDRFAAHYLGADGATPSDAFGASSATGEKGLKSTVAVASPYVPAFYSELVPSYAATSPACYVPSFKNYALASQKSSTGVSSTVTAAAKITVDDMSEDNSTSDSVVSPVKLSQAKHAARLARLARLAKSTPTATVTMSETTATKGAPVYSEAQSRWARLSEHAAIVGRAALDETEEKERTAKAANGERVVERVSAADLQRHAEEARERVANAEIARELARRKSQITEASGDGDFTTRGRQLIRGRSGFATFAAANGSAAMSPMAIAAVGMASAASISAADMSEEDAYANAQQTFVSSSIVTMFLAACLICGDRFGDLVQFATGQGMFMY